MRQSRHEIRAQRPARLREEKDKFFKLSPHSPLTAKQRQHFTSLNYYPYNPGLDIPVEVNAFAQTRDMQLQTTTGEARWYRRFGEFHFSVAGERGRLTIYQTPDGYFLPFRDATSAAETYSAGRYLEPSPLSGGKFFIDFNQAYNPYCAYGEGWACPLTPAENQLPMRITAGGKLPGAAWTVL